jgi:hypothetical protein
MSPVAHFQRAMMMDVDQAARNEELLVGIEDSSKASISRRTGA